MHHIFNSYFKLLRNKQIDDNLVTGARRKRKRVNLTRDEHAFSYARVLRRPCCDVTT